MAGSLSRRQETGRLKVKKRFNEFEMGGFMAQRDLWNLGREKCCSCMREDGEDKKERKMEVDRETKEEMSKRG